MAGTLYVVATPIGNLEDLTFRALRILREVDLVAAEDTRRTAKLLARYDVRRPMTSLREHNETREAPRLIERLRRGESLALVSDAGTPGISDPGARLVRAVREAGLVVVPVPGPSAVTAALSASGVSGHQFVFLGFPPASGKARTAWLEMLASELRTVVFLEAPHRIRRTLRDIAMLVKRQIYVHREISKINEEWVVYTNTTDSACIPERGEFTIVIEAPAERDKQAVDEFELFANYSSLVNKSRSNEPLVFGLLASANGLEPNEVRRIVKKMRILVKQQSETGP